MRAQRRERVPRTLSEHLEGFRHELIVRRQVRPASRARVRALVSNLEQRHPASGHGEGTPVVTLWMVSTVTKIRESRKMSTLPFCTW